MKFVMMMAVTLLYTPSCEAGIKDWFKRKTRSEPSLSEADASSGIRQALTIGVENAIALLSADGGYLDDDAVRIGLPEKFQKTERLLRRLGQGDKVDELVETMNRAAESAVGETTELFVDAIDQMTLRDVQEILTGGTQAATDYFRSRSEDRLVEIIQPIVNKATSETGVTRAYKDFIGGNSLLSRLGDRDELDIDLYITQRAIDGLFVKLAEQETLIREDPVARTTELLRRVFGSG